MNSQKHTSDKYPIDISTKEAYLASMLKMNSISENITKSITLNEKLDSQVETYLVEMGDEFLSSILESACLYAKHRGSDTLSNEDILLAMSILYNISEPSKANSTLFNQLKYMEINKSCTADHKKRLELTREENKNSLD